METYSKASRVKLIFVKGLYIGSWKNKHPEFRKNKMERLSLDQVQLCCYNMNYEELWMQKFIKFKTKIQSWKKGPNTTWKKSL